MNYYRKKNVKIHNNIWITTTNEDLNPKAITLQKIKKNIKKIYLVL